MVGQIGRLPVDVVYKPVLIEEGKDLKCAEILGPVQTCHYNYHGKKSTSITPVGRSHTIMCA